jgi:hypothetical protein
VGKKHKTFLDGKNIIEHCERQEQEGGKKGEIKYFFLSFSFHFSY